MFNSRTGSFCHIWKHKRFASTDLEQLTVGGHALLELAHVHTLIFCHLQHGKCSSHLQGDEKSNGLCSVTNDDGIRQPFWLDGMSLVILYTSLHF